MTASASATEVRPIVHTFWRELWLRTALQGIVVVAAYFLGWELIEHGVLPPLSPADLRVLHIVRGAGAAFLLGTWSFLRIRQARLECDAEMTSAMARLEDRVRARTGELEEARAFTERLFDSLRERVVVYEPSGRVVKRNRAAGAGGALAKRATVGNVGGRNTCSDVVGRLWEVETITIPDREGAPAYFVEVGRDVTDAENLEAQVRHQEKMAALGVLTAGFAHDLGNPLASLCTELEILETEEDIEEMRRSLAVLRQHTGRMARTLREMVDFARRRRDELADVSIGSAITDSARLVRHDPRWKQVGLVVEVDEDLPAVHIVEDHLVLVLVNLMLNAADAMPDGGTLTIRTAKRDGGIEITLTDTGEGMAPEVLARAKSPLFTTKGNRGTGLGLAVCDRIVRDAGGQLDIVSRRGAGTEITIWLPGAEGFDA